MDYPVADHGADPDMAGTMNSLKVAEASTGHNWKFGVPETKAAYHNVAKDTNYNFAPDLDKDIKNT